MTWRSNDFSWKVNQLNFSRTDILGYKLISTSLKESLSPWEIVVTSTRYCFAVSYGILSELLSNRHECRTNNRKSHIKFEFAHFLLSTATEDAKKKAFKFRSVRTLDSSIIFEHHFRTPRLLSARLKIIVMVPSPSWCMFYQTQPNNDDVLLIKAAGVTDSFLDHPLP